MIKRYGASVYIYIYIPTKNEREKERERERERGGEDFTDIHLTNVYIYIYINNEDPGWNHEKTTQNTV